ncbi:MAG: hypothetical protein ACOC1K_02875 [Nanoarchaeota archaeon]
MLITGDKTYQVKLHYIHNNPVQERWELVNKPEDYRYSSARFYFKGEDVDVPISHLGQD